jgi:general stress protein 26
MHANNPKTPVPRLPNPLSGYGLPDSTAALLPWDFVSKRMAAAKTYWVCTISAQSQPHVRPVWGVWVAETLFFGGGPDTRWFRNIKANPRIAIHLEDGNEAVIFEGTARLVEDGDVMTRLDDAYEEKYQLRHGPPLWQLQPVRAFAWQSMQSLTKFTFENGS